jgi:hypothetical protein
VSVVTETPQPRLPMLPAVGLGGGASSPPGEHEQQLDPELADLPGPPRRARTMTVLFLAVAALAALVATIGLRREVAYALVGSSPVGLGDLRVVPGAVLAANENRPIRAEGMLGAVGGIRYERPFVDDSFRALPVAGRAEPLDMWVEVRVPAGQPADGWAPPRSFAGRLVRLDAAGPRHRGLRAAIEQATHEHVPADAWLVVDGEDPPDARWAILVSLLFLGFAGWNAAATARILRKVAA